MKVYPVLFVLGMLGCAEAVPHAAMDRCQQGVADGNDGYTLRQGAACRIVAQSLEADDKPQAALSFARKACDLQDSAGCVAYLTLSRGQPGELTRARATGSKACDGMVVSNDGSDARPRLCFLTGELYDELEPRSADEAGRFYARACKLGDVKGCPRAKALGVDPDTRPEPVAKAPAPKPSAAPLPPPAPTQAAPTATVVTQVLAPACHEMKACVSLQVDQRNAREVIGTMTNKCDHTASCRWCPAKGTQVDKTQCHSGTFAPGETRSGTQWGLWYEGYDAMAYDCTEEHDPPACLAL